MSKNLIIVESPAKAKTIQKFIGKEYDVVSSKGHVRDLPEKDLGISVHKDFEPHYEIMPDKKKLIADIKKMATEASKVFLATDDDREGEAISWHLLEAAKIPIEKTKRIVFHEITKQAIEHALSHPRKLDIDLVNAQQARRILDRLVGFELSPVLWRKVKPQLSAGRVQSVAVKLIVERERDINQFQSTSNFKVIGQFQSEQNTKNELTAELNKRFDDKESAQSFLNDCKSAVFSVSSVEKSPGKKSPAPPFTTSTLQQEAARKLGFSVTKTMIIAQQLYEAGYITYMRTDSVNLSNLALSSAKQEIEKLYGAEYSKTRKYVTKIRGAQEAHEAIRPTDLGNQTIPNDTFAKRLYELIWKRTIASQMSDAITEKTIINIPVSNRNEKFVATGEVVLFQGFLKVYFESNDDEQDEILGITSPVVEGESLCAVEIKAVQKYTQPPLRFNEAGLVKKLEELGIGRPSTYAPTISIIQKREYVIKENRPGKERQVIQLLLKNNEITETLSKEKYGVEKDKLFPTDIGIVVNEYLQNNFENIMDYGFTAEVEKEFDDIAEGAITWQKMLQQFYTEFHDSIKNAISHSQKASGERILGQDGAGKNVYAKLGKYGPMIQIGENYEDSKAKYARLKKTQSIESISLEEALDLFKLPKTLGTYNDYSVIVAVGRFGAYIKYGEEYVSIPRNVDPLEIDIESARQLIDEKIKQNEAKAPRLLGQYDGIDVSVVVGKFGPYIKFNNQNITLEKGSNAATITLAEAIQQIKNVTTKNILCSFPEDDKIKIVNGRYGPYITNGADNFKLPKGVIPQQLTYQDITQIIAQTAPTAKKRFTRKK
ncbi:MAG: type I DNA topoisomerase [Bacteroidetes bacterium]|nr:type I DNA topoisomerase [Bacteroidota bacterium]MCL1968059.1 type I DNA topoisomerase [Bacteroidota bacterium]